MCTVSPWKYRYLTHTWVGPGGLDNQHTQCELAPPGRASPTMREKKARREGEVAKQIAKDTDKDAEIGWMPNEPSGR